MFPIELACKTRLNLDVPSDVDLTNVGQLRLPIQEDNGINYDNGYITTVQTSDTVARLVEMRTHT